MEKSERKRRQASSALYKGDATGEKRTFTVEELGGHLVSKINKDGQDWTRIPKPVPETRSDRRNSAVSSVQSVVDNLDAAIEAVDGLPENPEDRGMVDLCVDEPEFIRLKAEWAEAKAAIEEDVSAACSFDLSDAQSTLEDLKDELDSWKENLPESLQSGSKADELQEAVDALDSAISTLEGGSTPEFDSEDLDETKSQMETARTELEDAISEMEEVSFPGMY